MFSQVGIVIVPFLTPLTFSCTAFHRTLFCNAYYIFFYFIFFIVLTFFSSACSSSPPSPVRAEEKADKQVLIVSMFSLFFIYHSLSFALFLSEVSPSSLCVLPHGFPLRQYVALVITSCLKQTDGIRESDGQFSQRMCTQLPFFFFCVFSVCTLLLFSLPPPSLSHALPASLRSADVCCARVCVSE